MPSVNVNGIELAYEKFGTGEPVVLIMGLGCQMVMWDEQFCRDLSAQGFEVIRFDNRDVGASSRLDHLKARPIDELMKRRLTGKPVGAAYSLEDMAVDTGALIEALGHRSAHVVGMSLGGMVAQCLALQQPERVRSLNLIMTNSGELWTHLPTLRALSALTDKPGKTRESAIARQVQTFAKISGQKHASPTHLIEKMAGLQFDRGQNPRGFARQFAAIISAQGRLARLSKVRVPTHIIHGAEDPLVRPIGGRLLAATIPDARFDLVAGMGHDIGPSIWPFVIDRILANSRRDVMALTGKRSVANMWASPISV